MAFTHIRSMIAGAVEIAPPKDNMSYKIAGGETVSAGDVCYFDGGELKVAANGRMTCAVIALEDGAATEYIRCAWIAPGAVYRAPITDKDGSSLTSLDSTFKIGNTCQLNDDGDGLDGETTNDFEDEPLTIIQVDTENKMATVVFNSNMMSFDTKQGAT